MNHADGVFIRLNNLQLSEEVAVLLHNLECLDIPGPSIFEANREHGASYDDNVAQCDGRKIDAVFNFLLLIPCCDLRDVTRVDISDDASIYNYIRKLYSNCW